MRPGTTELAFATFRTIPPEGTRSRPHLDGQGVFCITAVTRQKDSPRASQIKIQLRE
jgi:hypothetical protein